MLARVLNFKCYKGCFFHFAQLLRLRPFTHRLYFICARKASLSLHSLTLRKIRDSGNPLLQFTSLVLLKVYDLYTVVS